MVIAKITKGSRPGDIAAYLHGPGKANEHRYERRSGGAVIGGNLGREGDRNGNAWAQDLRAATRTRDEIKNPIWHASLRAAPGDRRLSDAEWRDAGQHMAEKLGYENHPWVMVRHGDDHVHVVVSRVSEEGEVWHARQDYRKAQTAATEIENRYGLQHAPRTRNAEQTRKPQSRVVESQQKQAQHIQKERTETLEQAREAYRIASLGQAPVQDAVRTKPTAQPAERQQYEAAERIRRAREQGSRDNDRDRGR